MVEHNVIEIGDLRLIEGKDICTNNIQSIEDFKDLNKKIERRIKLYRLDSLLLKIHDISLSYEDADNINLDFIAGMITKYALLNSNVYSGLFPIYDFIISDSFFLYINTYQRVIFDGFSYVFRTIGHQSIDKICKSANKINCPMKSACRKNKSRKVLSKFLQDA